MLGATHTNFTSVLPGVPTTPVGTPATVRGVTLLDALEYAPVPAALIAATLKVYAVPLVRPVTVAFRSVDTASLKVVHLPLRHDCTA